jgi:hypothetical protein
MPLAKDVSKNHAIIFHLETYRLPGGVEQVKWSFLVFAKESPESKKKKQERR